MKSKRTRLPDTESTGLDVFVLGPERATYSGEETRNADATDRLGRSRRSFLFLLSAAASDRYVSCWDFAADIAMADIGRIADRQVPGGGGSAINQAAHENIAKRVIAVVDLSMTFGTLERNHVANCPQCDTPHRYTEFKFPMINDRGSWLVACRNCSHRFVIQLRNPVESHSDQCLIIERFDDDINPYKGSADGPGASAVYQLDMNADRSRFELDRFVIYRCATSDDDLEKAAFIALREAWPAIADQRGNAMNYMLARSRFHAVEHATITVDVLCSCGGTHQAIFYHPFRLDDSEPPLLEDLLLADVSGADLSDALTGILTKTEVMDALEKLIARWRLFSDQILLATPFVAHQWKSKAERLTIWERLLSRLDPTRTLLVTRGATFTDRSGSATE